MPRNAITKYLRGHAEPEARDLRLAHVAGMRRVVCVPVYDERPEHLEPLLLELAALSEAGGILAILVVNERDDSPARVATRNRQLLNAVRARYGGGWSLGRGLSEHETPFGGLLLVSRLGPDAAIPRKQGVGLARKIGADLALSLYASGQLQAEVIHCTDADARLPHDYFGRLPDREAGGAYAAVFPFEHMGGEPEVATATHAYELMLRYYVVGLARAGSPYAMQTIGSTIAVSMAAYAAVRGFPRRHGAEDFYVLNKLAKIGPIERLPGAPIRLRARVSDRIPFGTGPAVGRIVGGRAQRFYHPDTFALLADLLAGLTPLLDPLATHVPSTARALVDRLCPRLPASTAARLLDSSGVLAMLSRARTRHADVAARLRHVHTGFDAFRTLKWVHALRDQCLGDADAASAIGACLGRPAGTLADDLRALRAVERAVASGPVGVDPVTAAWQGIGTKDRRE